jgi:hypothetical protein
MAGFPIARASIETSYAEARTSMSKRRPVRLTAIAL